MRTKAQKPRSDIYQTITEKLLAAIEANPGDPIMPWQRGGAQPVLPTNAVTGQAYRGVNILSLWVSALERGYNSGEWATLRQWNEKGARVRKGEKASPIVFFKEIAVTSAAAGGADDEEAGTERRRFARGYWVFAAEQVDGYQPATALPPNPIERIAAAEAYFAATGARVIIGGTQACYRRSTDTIHMPDEARFIATDGRTRTEAWYGVLGHESTHYADLRIMPRRSAIQQTGVHDASAAYRHNQRRFQEGEQLVARAVAAVLRLDRPRLGDGLLLHLHVGVDVHLRRLDRFVTEPERDHRTIDAAVQELHCGAVAENVRRDAFRAQGSACLRCCLDVPANDALHGIAAEAGAAIADEQRIVRLAFSLCQPVAEQFDAVLADRRRTLLAAFAHTADVRATPERDVVARQRDQLRDAQARLQCEQEDRPVTPTVPGRKVGSRDDGFDLVTVEIVDRPLLVPLCRHGEHTLAMMQQLRLIDGDVLVERADGREPCIAAPCSITPRLLEIGEEVGDEVGVDIGDLQRRRLLLLLIGGIPEEQAERVAIARDRIRAGLHLGPSRSVKNRCK